MMCILYRVFWRSGKRAYCREYGDFSAAHDKFMGIVKRGCEHAFLRERTTIDGFVELLTIMDYVKF